MNSDQEKRGSPHQRPCPYTVRVQIGGVDAYTVGMDSEGEAEVIANMLNAKDDVQETEVCEV